MASSGWNKPLAANKPTVKAPKKPSAMRGIAAGFVAVAVAVACIVIFMGRDDEVTIKKAEKKPSQIKTVTPAPAPKAAVPKAVPTAKAEKKPDAAGHAATNNVAEPISRRAPRGTPRILEEALARGERVKPLFKFPSENYLALYAIPGDDVPPTPEPDDFEQDMMNALASPIEIEEGDTEDDIDRKRIVAGMKEELKEYIKAGGDLNGYLEEVKNRQKQEAELVAHAREITQNAVREEDADPSHCLEVWTKANEELAAKGIPPVPMPRRLRTYLKRNTTWDGKTPLVEGMKAPKSSSPKTESNTEGQNE